MNLELKELVLDSREVAKMLNKEHKHLLRDIAKNLGYLTETKIGLSEFFKETQYKDSTGKKNKRYDITKKGCEFLAHKLTGKKGAIFTATYINKFHEMEQALTSKPIQAKLPLEDIKPTTLNGVPVMEIQALAKMLGVSESHIHWLFRNDKTTLRGSKLINYKKENKNIRDYIRVNNISVLYKEIVITICKHFKVYEKYKDFIEKYFYVAKQIEYKTEKPFDDFYYNEMFECMKKAYQLESQVENIYNDKLLPIYNRIEELNNLKRDTMLTPFNAMKYGNVLGKRK